MPGKQHADVKAALKWLEAQGTERYRDQMDARFGIVTDKAFGTSMADVKLLAKTIGKDHELAQALWDSGWHEAKALAAFVVDPKQVTKRIARREAQRAGKPVPPRRPKRTS